MKAFHVDSLLIRRQFPSITVSAEESRIVSTVLIILVLPLLRENISLDSSVIGYIFKTSCDKVW